MSLIFNTRADSGASLPGLHSQGAKARPRFVGPEAYTPSRTKVLFGGFFNKKSPIVRA